MKTRLMVWTALLLTMTGVSATAQPLTLEQCTAIALRKNPQIVSSQQLVVGAQAALTGARSSYYPQLSLGAVEGIAGGTTASAGGGASDTRDKLDLALGMTFWQRGREQRVEQSKASLRISEFDQASTTQELVTQVARDFYSVLATQQLLEVVQAGVESARGHLEQVNARIALGAAADVEVFPVENDLAQAQLDLIDAQSNVHLAVAQLRNTMGVSPDTELELAPSPPASDEAVPSLQEALALALKKRPEILAGGASLQASGFALAQAKIERGPLVDLSGQYTRQYAQWQQDDSSWDLLVTVSYPLFDGHAAKANETAARANLKRSQADLQRVINQVTLEVENALVEMQRTGERVGASQKSVAAAEARLAAAEGKYQQGVGILLEVIDARVAVTNARAVQVQARYDHQTARTALQRALGTLPVPEL